MNNYETRTARIMERLQQLATFSQEPTTITRVFGTQAFVDGRNKVVQWMQEAGLEVRIDSIGNVRGRLKSENANAKVFVIASHIDTVQNAGMFDGPLGVIMGIELLSVMSHNATHLPFHFELVAFSDEEGVRFHSTFLGSHVLAGSFDRELLEKTDENGITLQQAIECIGGDVDELENDAIKPYDWLGYFEIHIEQGPVLYEKKFPSAIVSAIAGQKRVEIRFIGMAGHAGTVPLYMRHDALCSAAEFVLEAEALALSHAGSLMSTVGKLNIVNAASNVIPGEVICSLDLRSENDKVLESAYATIRARCQDICDKRSILLTWKLVQETAPVTCDASLNDLLASSMQSVTGNSMRLVSGAGHDAVPISAIAPVCMLFVRCFEGISHNPLEYAESSDICKSLEISEQFLKLLINKHKTA